MDQLNSQLIDALGPQINDIIGSRGLWQSMQLGLGHPNEQHKSTCRAVLAKIEITWPGRFPVELEPDLTSIEYRSALLEIAERVTKYSSRFQTARLYDTLMGIIAHNRTWKSRLDEYGLVPDPHRKCIREKEWGKYKFFNWKDFVNDETEYAWFQDCRKKLSTAVRSEEDRFAKDNSAILGGLICHIYDHWGN